jgi:ferrous iron transport protein A
MTLDQLRINQAANIVAVRGEPAFRRRLMELGLLPDTPIRRTGAAPLGDPMTFGVRGAVLALRKAEASLIDVSPPWEST